MSEPHKIALNWTRAEIVDRFARIIRNRFAPEFSDAPPPEWSSEAAETIWQNVEAITADALREARVSTRADLPPRALTNILAYGASPPEYPGLALVPKADLDELRAWREAEHQNVTLTGQHLSSAETWEDGYLRGWESVALDRAAAGDAPVSTIPAPFPMTEKEAADLFEPSDD